MPKSFRDFLMEAKSRIQEVEASAAIADHGKVLVLDVREPGEHQQARIPGSLNVPRGLLEAKADPELPTHEKRLGDRKQPILVQCASGGRSALAADVLQQMGFENVRNLVGGIGAWEKAGGPIEKG